MTTFVAEPVEGGDVFVGVGVTADAVAVRADAVAVAFTAEAVAVAFTADAVPVSSMDEKQSVKVTLSSLKVPVPPLAPYPYKRNAALALLSSPVIVLRSNVKV
jgi:hypothetical protein